MSEWQDISSAPKDGTPVLLFDPAYKTHVGSYLPRQAEYEPGDLAVFSKEKWICWSNRTCCNFLPTHWMPLPSPPVTITEVKDDE